MELEHENRENDKSVIVANAFWLMRGQRSHVSKSITINRNKGRKGFQLNVSLSVKLQPTASFSNKFCAFEFCCGCMNIISQFEVGVWKSEQSSVRI